MPDISPFGFKMSTAGLPTATNNLGGPFQGYSPQQTIDNYKNSEDVIARREVRRAWNTSYATGKHNDLKRIVTPFRAVTNSGDFLSRKNYVCGGPNPANNTHTGYKISLRGIINSCDGTNVPSSSCNVKFVPDSSEYTKFRRQQAFNQNYNDVKNGGYTNSAYVNIIAVRRR
jgi:hypothetical protein